MHKLRAFGPALLALLAVGTPSGSAVAEVETRAVVDRVAVRFYSPETGGTAHPRFITERILAFEARLDGLSDDPSVGGSGQAERHLRNALDRHLVEEMLATLDKGSLGSAADDARLEREARADLEQRAGGEGPIGIAAEEEGLDGAEINAVFVRRAKAAAYLDRSVTRFLHPSDEQLREVYRTSPHPFRNRAFEDVRGALARWFVFERLKVIEAAFLQTARSRVTVVVVPR